MQLNQDLRVNDQVLVIRDGEKAANLIRGLASISPSNVTDQRSPKTQVSFQEASPYSDKDECSSHRQSLDVAGEKIERAGTINLSDEKLANMKSPVFLKLEMMIETINKFHNEVDGRRVPNFQKAFMMRKKAEDEHRRRQKMKQERMRRASHRVSDRQEAKNSISPAQMRSLERKNREMRSKMTTLEVFNQYKVNDYKVSLPQSMAPAPQRRGTVTNRVKFDHEDVDLRISPNRLSVTNYQLSHQSCSTNTMAGRSPRVNDHHLYSKDTILSRRNSVQHDSDGNRRGSTHNFNFGQACNNNKSVEKRASLLEKVGQRAVKINNRGDEIDLNDDSSSGSAFVEEGEGGGLGGLKIKRRPGETKEQAIERVKKQREVARVRALMKFAYPRQREAYFYKKKLLGPDEQNQSVDLLQLKLEFKRQDKERSMMTSQVNNQDSIQNESLFQHLESGLGSSKMQNANKIGLFNPKSSLKPVGMTTTAPSQQKVSTQHSQIGQPQMTNTTSLAESTQGPPGATVAQVFSPHDLSSASTLQNETGVNGVNPSQIVLAGSSIHTFFADESIQKQPQPVQPRNRQTDSLASEDSLMEAMPAATSTDFVHKNQSLDHLVLQDQPFMQRSIISIQEQNNNQASATLGLGASLNQDSYHSQRSIIDEAPAHVEQSPFVKHPKKVSGQKAALRNFASNHRDADSPQINPLAGRSSAAGSSSKSPPQSITAKRKYPTSTTLNLGLHRSGIIDRKHEVNQRRQGSKSPTLELQRQKVVQKRKELILKDVIRMQTSISSVLQNFQDSMSQTNGPHTTTTTSSRFFSQKGQESPAKALAGGKSTGPKVRIEAQDETISELEGRKRGSIASQAPQALFMPKIGVNANLRLSTTRNSPKLHNTMIDGLSQRAAYMAAGQSRTMAVSQTGPRSERNPKDLQLYKTVEFMAISNDRSVSPIIDAPPPIASVHITSREYQSTRTSNHGHPTTRYLSRKARGEVRKNSQTINKSFLLSKNSMTSTQRDSWHRKVERSDDRKAARGNNQLPDIRLMQGNKASAIHSPTKANSQALKNRRMKHTHVSVPSQRNNEGATKINRLNFRLSPATHQERDL